MIEADRERAELRPAAERVLAWLAETDPLPPAPCDAIIGFGMFDFSLPRFCGELYRRGAAPRIIFTGGIGAGTGDLGGPEADVWRAALRQTHPEIPDCDLILENRSTNTAENVAFTAELLRPSHPATAFGIGIRTVIIVASPSRLRRVRLTLRRQQPGIQVVRRLPRVSFETEQALYTAQGIDYLGHLAGEIERILEYPDRGWIAPEPVPGEILRAHGRLRRTLSA